MVPRHKYAEMQKCVVCFPSARDHPSHTHSTPSAIPEAMQNQSCWGQWCLSSTAVSDYCGIWWSRTTCPHPSGAGAFTHTLMHILIWFCSEHPAPSQRKIISGEESRWRRNRTGRSLSLLQIHRKNNRTVNKVYKTTSDRYQRTSGAQKSSPLFSKGGRTKISKIKKGHKNEGQRPVPGRESQ